MIIINSFKYEGIDHGQGGGTLILMSEIFYFSMFFIGSLSYLFLSKENSKAGYFAVPLCIYLLGTGYMFFIREYYLSVSLFIAFFPTHIYSYFKLRKLGKLNN
ncbi:hypothetical protein BOQ64_10370 [Chryseobacterium sp. CH25]|nr:hypothetical protein BOQ64_10370 [Chryseobacterium sp. CH25]RXM64139.1 hypothetical protein BOQ60_14740 [Chryseobacterium sp. CH1]